MCSPLQCTTCDKDRCGETCNDVPTGVIEVEFAESSMCDAFTKTPQFVTGGLGAHQMGGASRRPCACAPA